MRAEDWWDAASASALIGTARRQPPAPPEGFGERADAGPEARLLDAAAVAGALRRAGRVPLAGRLPDPAPDETAPVAPERARQLLHLLVAQPPVRAALRPLVLGHWLRACAETGHRVPHALLPALLDAATGQPANRADARRVLGHRGRWLARANPTWSWAATEEPDADEAPDDWATLTAVERAAWVQRLRASAPDAARTLVESTWDTDAAKDRDALLATLRSGLGPADEELLERALDDRSPSVRATAQRLLDGLPGSTRAARMAARLSPLISVSGLVRKTLHLELPGEPDAEGVRDGLGKPPPGRSRRGHHLELLAAGAPFEVWTIATGRDPADTVRMVSDEDALRGLVRATRARRDPVWAEALLPVANDPGLLALVPQRRREEIAARTIRDADIRPALRLVLDLPGPWGEELSRAVVARLRRHAQPVHEPGLVAALAAALHPAVLPEVRQWAQTHHTWADLPDDLAQFLSLVPAIAEAFR